jgi:hypothetical protein
MLRRSKSMPMPIGVALVHGASAEAVFWPGTVFSLIGRWMYDRQIGKLTEILSVAVSAPLRDYDASLRRNLSTIQAALDLPDNGH